MEAQKKRIKLALYNRESGAQGCTYHGTLKNVYRIVKPEAFKVPKNERQLEALEKRGIVKFLPPEEKKYLYSSSSASGGIFRYEYVNYYEVEAPVLVEVISVCDGKWNQYYKVVSEDVNEEPEPEYNIPFSSVIAEAEKVDNCSGIPIEELAKLRCRRVGANRDNLHGDDYDSYELENGCRATLFYRRTLSADVGYRMDYTKLLRIYPP
ncbi:MAG: hypothetical protein QXG57_05975 [Thermofilaceae archaeon]